MKSKLGTMFGDVLRSLFRSPATELFPYVRKPSPDRLRGKLVWEPEKCAGCMLCVKDCPSDAIELVVLDKVNKKFVLRYHADRCTFCAQCVVSCRFDCLHMSSEMWELASTQKEPFTVYYGKDEDVNFLLEKMAKDNAGENECPE
ncbi:MAG TPA: 4Fe-4S binding protein [Anaerolinea sp.]|nr:4Fe-4S binding protein [Anaerolinea sp.]